MENGFGAYNRFGLNMDQLGILNVFGTQPTASRSNYDSSDKDSLSSFESEEETTEREDSRSQGNYCLNNNKFRSDFEVLTPEIVESVIEPMLSLSELISLVFLLYDSRNALQVIIALIAAGPEYFQRDKISVWVRSWQINWQAMLLEGLAVIQNYQILKRLGYDKEEINVRFQPSYNTALYISRVKKLLYKTMECLTDCEAKVVGDLFQFYEKFQPTFDPEYKYMEFHVLNWVEHGYITIDGDILNLDKLIHHLELSIFDSPLLKSVVRELKSFVDDTNSTYPIIDADEVGLLIIINIEEFHCESNLKYRHLLSNETLGPRKGTKMDVERLIKIFTQMNFKVVVGDNFVHFDFKKNICSYVRKYFLKTHSMIVLCVLSHGKEGLVYAANSIPISIKEITDIFSETPQISKLLANKPKVIIIQACQGSKRLTIATDKEMDGKKTVSKKIDGDLYTDESQLTFAGPEKFFPRHGDILLCMAIIPGYAAVRCPKKGTIYIQALCDCLLKHYKKKHFFDIVTIVHEKLNADSLHIKNQPIGSNCKKDKDCQVVYMTPIQFSTLTKELYLVPASKV